MSREGQHRHHAHVVDPCSRRTPARVLWCSVRAHQDAEMRCDIFPPLPLARHEAPDLRHPRRAESARRMLGRLRIHAVEEKWIADAWRRAAYRHVGVQQFACVSIMKAASKAIIRAASRSGAHRTNSPRVLPCAQSFPRVTSRPGSQTGRGQRAAGVWPRNAMGAISCTG